MSSKDVDSKFLSLRKSGWKGGIDHNGNAVMSRTDKHGNPLPLFKGGTGHGTPDDKRGKK
jgi:hypothetical protein